MSDPRDEGGKDLARITWVAHRGYPSRFPENTLVGYQAAMDCGARYVELDVQLTADEVPMLQHDVSLLRMSGIDEDIVDIHGDDLVAYPASYPERFGRDFAENRFCTLDSFAQWFCGWPQATAFVEVKVESVRHFGVGPVVDAIYECVRPILDQCVIISFDDSVVERVRIRELSRYGWVLPHWGSDTERRAHELQPAFLFCSTDVLPPDDHARWQGPWEWVIYNIDDSEAANRMAERGVHYLETNRIGEMLAETGTR